MIDVEDNRDYGDETTYVEETAEVETSRVYTDDEGNTGLAHEVLA